MKFAIKLEQHYSPHLRHIAKLPREIKHSNFCRYSADIEENAINCILSASTLISLHV